MLGEGTGTVVWNFAIGGTRLIQAVFSQPANPLLKEDPFERVETSDMVLYVPYDDVKGVSASDRDDWVTVRGVDYDVLNYGPRDGGCRRIECVRSTRLHETPRKVFSTR